MYVLVFIRVFNNERASLTPSNLEQISYGEFIWRHIFIKILWFRTHHFSSQTRRRFKNSFLIVDLCFIVCLTKSWRFYCAHRFGTTTTLERAWNKCSIIDYCVSSCIQCSTGVIGTKITWRYCTLWTLISIIADIYVVLRYITNSMLFFFLQIARSRIVDAGSGISSHCWPHNDNE